MANISNESEMVLSSNKINAQPVQQYFTEQGNDKEAVSLTQSITQLVQKYFAELKGTDAVNLYSLVMEEIEVPLLKAVMEHCKYNQSKAAIVLGISRGTLRAKLQHYFDDKYIGSRE